MPILLAGDLDANERDQWLALLHDALPDETFVTESHEADSSTIDIALVANPPPGSLQGLPQLRLIQSLWAGVDRLLGDATLPPGVPLARLVDAAMNQAMAETALWAVLSLQRDFFRYAAQQREARWQPWPQRRADETTVAVLGLGQMGTAVAQRLAANGYAVRGWRTRDGDAALPQVLAGAQIVISLLPLTAATTGLFDAARFALMSPGAAFVNLARGAQVVDADLLAALDSGRLSQAVLDVFHAEPLPAAHPFWRHPRISMLPHVAAQTDAHSAVAVVAANVRAVRTGGAVAHLVDRQRGY